MLLRRITPLLAAARSFRRVLASGILSAPVALSRAQASGVESTLASLGGSWERVGADQPRISGGTVVGRNLIRNPRQEGVNANSLPSLWTQFFSANLGTVTRTVTPLGVIDGQEVFRYVFSGAASASGGGAVYFDGAGFSALPSQVWTLSAFLGNVTVSNVSSARIIIIERLGSSYVRQTNGATAIGTTSLTRFAVTGTMGSGMGNILPTLDIFVPSAGAWSFSVDVSRPQLEPGQIMGEVSLPPVGQPGPSVAYGRMLGQNLVRNPRGAGASGSIDPTNWQSGLFTGAAGVTISRSQVTRDGIPGVLFTLSGTPSASGAFRIYMETTTDAPAATGQTWTFSAFVQGDTLAGLTNSLIVLDENTGAGAYVSGGQTVIALPGATMSRVSMTRTLAGGATVGALRPYLSFNITNGVPVSGAVFVGSPQLEPSNTAGTLSLPPEGVQRASQVATVGETTGRLLIEGQRTNGIRNPRCEGAIAGNPGTTPTHWSLAASGNGVTREIVGSGVENGLPYVDIRYSGTATANTSPNIIFESVRSNTAANPGEIVTLSAFIRLVEGAIPGGVQPLLVLANFNSVGAALSQFAINNLTLTTTLTRYSVSTTASTFSDANTALAQTYIQINFTSGATFNFVIRVAAPQYERAAFRSSPILPPVGAPGPATRGFDNVSAPAATLFPAGRGALALSGLLTSITGGESQTLFSLNDGTTGRQLRVVNQPAMTNGVRNPRGEGAVAGIARAPVAISAISVSGNVMTVTTASPHGLAALDTVTLSGVTPASYNGARSVSGVPGATTFTMTTTGIADGSASAVGSYTAASPGTAPTNWQIVGVTSLIPQVVGAGVENGIDYVDIRWNGIPGISSFSNIVLDTNVPALPGQTWTASAFVKLVAGTLANTSVIMEAREATAGAGFLANSSTSFVPTTGPLAAQRRSATRTLNNGSTALFRPHVSLQTTAGLPIDITLRIGWPQAEQGASASLPLLPAPGSPNAVTSRPAGTLTLASEDATTGAYGYADLGTVAAGTPFRVGAAWDAGSVRGVLDAGAVQTLAVGAPGGPTTLRLGAEPGGVNAMFGEVGELRAAPFAAPDAQLRSLVSALAA